MRRLIVRAEQFVEWFHRVVPGAYREITTEDVEDMTRCELIGRHGEYLRLDIEIVRCVLLYEQLRENRQKRDEIKDDDGVIHCRRCGVVLVKPKAKRGRPNEFCENCQPFRGRERNKKWRSRHGVMAMN